MLLWSFLPNEIDTRNGQFQMAPIDTDTSSGPGKGPASQQSSPATSFPWPRKDIGGPVTVGGRTHPLQRYYYEHLLACG
jgi:hypothetical protein